jgi:peptide/nickel transport system substrate-binding protein
MWSDSSYDRKMAEVYLTRDETKRHQMLRELTVEIYVWLPTPYIFTAWWPRGPEL